MQEIFEIDFTMLQTNLEIFYSYSFKQYVNRSINITNGNADIDKDKVYLIGIMKKFLSNLNNTYKIGQEFTFLYSKFYMIILSDQEKETFFETRLVKFFSETLKTCKFELGSGYSLYFFCYNEDKDTIKNLVNNYSEEIQFVFKSKKYKKFKNLILDIFGLYGSYNSIKMISMYLESGCFSFRKLTSKYNHRCDYGGIKGNLEIDIKIMKKIIKEGKEKFQEKMDLLYLINKNILFDDFLFSLGTFFYDILPEIRTNKSQNKPKIKEFKGFMTNLIYLCCYITKEYLGDYMFDGKKYMIKQYAIWGGKSEEEFKNEYNNTTIEKIKNLMLLKDEESSRNLEKSKSK